MRFKLFPTASRVAALLLLSVAGTAAQVLQISSKVTLKQPAGSVMPVEGADVDIYRLDISRKFLATTDARGVYVKAGIPFVGTYAIAVSAPGARPDYRASVRFAQQPVNDFALVPGDGSRLTLEQIKAVAARPTVENEKIVAANETVKRTFNAGNEALAANRLDDAVAQYHEGLAARPDELALLINLSEALRRRGVNRFNDSIKTRDERARAAAKNDWKEAADAALKAVELIRALPVPPDPAQQSAQARNRLAALSIAPGHCDSSPPKSILRGRARRSPPTAS